MNASNEDSITTRSEGVSAEPPKDPTVHWIDDCSGQIFNIAAGAISFLWDNQVISRIYMFGDGSWQGGAVKGPSEKHETNMNKTITQIFRSACIEHDRMNWEPEGSTYVGRKDLIKVNSKGLASIVRVIQSSGDDSSISELMEVWSNPDKLKALKTNAAELSLTQEKLIEFGFSIDALMKQIELFEGDIIALDVLLLKHDHDLILEQQLPSVSMAIYNWCQLNKVKCYVYSHYSFDDNLVKEWTEIYKQVFDYDPPKTIYMENRLTKNEENTDILSLLRLVKGEKDAD